MAKYSPNDLATQMLRNVAICPLVQLGKKGMDIEGKEKVRSRKVSCPQELFIQELTTEVEQGFGIRAFALSLVNYSTPNGEYPLSVHRAALGRRSTWSPWRLAVHLCPFAPHTPPSPITSSVVEADAYRGHVAMWLAGGVQRPSVP